MPDRRFPCGVGVFMDKNAHFPVSTEKLTGKYLIEVYQADLSQWVPTSLLRLLENLSQRQKPLYGEERFL